MKELLGIATLCLIMIKAPFYSPLMAEDATEINGIIKNVSVNVHLVVIDAAEKGVKEGDNTEPTIKSVSVEPNTRITVNGKQATINDLQAGQAVKAKVETNSSKAVTIDANTAVSQQH
jgi:biopolymer transport protein ExbD